MSEYVQLADDRDSKDKLLTINDGPTPIGQDAKSSEGNWTWDYCFVFAMGTPEKKIELKEREITLSVPFRNSKGQHEYKTVTYKKKSAYPAPLVQLFGHHANILPQSEFFQKRISESVEALKHAGLKTLLYNSIGKDEIYCLVGATESRLAEEAERTEMDLLLNPDAAIEAGLRVKPPLYLALRTKSPTAEQDNLGASIWAAMYGKYSQEKDKLHPGLYQQYDSDYLITGETVQRRNKTVFKTIDRLKLIRSIIEADHRVGGANLRINSFKPEVQPLLACFPLHNKERLQFLEQDWKGLKATFSQPLTGIREYFGEQIGFYFAFLEVYNRWMLLPAFLGLIAFIVQLATGDIDNGMTAAFGFFMSIWTTVLIEKWKRKQVAISTDWGQSNFLVNEQARAEFEGIWQPSPTDGRMQELFPFEIKTKRKICSQTIIWSLIAVVVGLVVSIFVLRSVLLTWDPTYGGVVSGIINAFQIQIMNFIYTKVAYKLNDWENHKTQTEYEDALIAKSFLFKFVNSYNSLFYIAFIKRFDVTVEGCADDDPTCLRELQTQLASIFLTQLIVNNAMELFTPWYQNRARGRADGGEKGLSLRESSTDRTVPEKEYEMESYTSTFSDWDEIVIQFGYVSLFVVAFPLNPLLCVISGVIETRLDAYKLIHLSRRPAPRGAANIGTWLSIIDIVSVIAVITNIALVMFVSGAGDYISEYDTVTKFLLFFIFEHGILLVKFLLGTVIPDVSNQISEHLLRQEHIVEVLIKDAEEEPDVAHDEDEKEISPEVLKDLPIGTEIPTILQHKSAPVLINNVIPGRFSGRRKWWHI